MSGAFGVVTSVTVRPNTAGRIQNPASAASNPARPPASAAFAIRSRQRLIENRESSGYFFSCSLIGAVPANIVIFTFQVSDTLGPTPSGMFTPKSVSLTGNSVENLSQRPSGKPDFLI